MAPTAGTSDSAGRSGSGLTQTAGAGNQDLISHSSSSVENGGNRFGDSAGRSGSGQTQTAGAGNQDVAKPSSSSLKNQSNGSGNSAGRSGSGRTQTAGAGNQDPTNHSCNHSAPSVAENQCNGLGDSAGRSGSGRTQTAGAGNLDQVNHIMDKKAALVSDKSDLIREAEEYVNSVMSGNSIIITHGTPLQSKKRGRRLSMPDESVIKRARNISAESSDSVRRKLDMNSEDVTGSLVTQIKSPCSEVPPREKETSNGRKPKKARKKSRKVSGNNSECIITRADIHVDSDLDDMDAKQMLLKIYNDMNMKFSALQSSVQEMEANIEKKVTINVKKVLDKRINEETSKMNKDMSQKIDGARADFNKDVIELSKRLEKLETRNSKNVEQSELVKTDISKNLVIRQLPESVNERLSDKVEALLKDGCKLSDIKLEKVERKQSRNASKPGVVIATAASEADKQRIMDAKSRLKGSRRYSDVYINNDQTRDERLMSANFRSMIRAYKDGNKEINFRGRRVINSENVSNSDSTKAKSNNPNSVSNSAMPRNEDNNYKYSNSKPHHHQNYDQTSYSGKVKYSGGNGYRQQNQSRDPPQSNNEWNRRGEYTSRERRDYRVNHDFYNRRDVNNRRDAHRQDDRRQRDHGDSHSRHSATFGYGSR